MLQTQNPGLVLYDCSIVSKTLFFSVADQLEAFDRFSYTKRFIWLWTLSALIYTLICTYLLTSALPCRFHEMLIMPNQHFSAMVEESILKLWELYGSMCNSAGLCSESQVLVPFLFFCKVVIDCQAKEVFIYET